MTPILLHKDTRVIAQELQTANDAINYYQSFLDRYNALGLAPMQPDDFGKFVENPKAFIVNVLSEGKTLKIGRLEIDPTKAFDLFPLPEEAAELAADVENIKYNSHLPAVYNYLLQHIETTGATLKVKQSYIDYVNEKSTLYTKTEDQNNALILSEKIAADISTLRNLQKKQGFHNGIYWLHELFKEQKNGSETIFTVDRSKIQNY